MSARYVIQPVIVCLCVLSGLVGCGGGKTATAAPAANPDSSNPAPTLTSLNPASAPAGSAGITITATGQNFLSTSVIYWNSSPLPTSYTSSTKLTAQVATVDLQSAGNSMITVVNPSPGGGTSNALTFVVSASAQANAAGYEIKVHANDLAWDPVNQVIYLSLPSSDGPSGNTVQVLHPTTGALGASAFAGSEPNLLAVSKSSRYLYISLNGASEVQRMTLPGLGTDIAIPLGKSSLFGSYFAMNMQAGPASDGTVAVVRETPNTSPAEEGGVIIYDNGTARPNELCGWTPQPGCTTYPSGLYDSIQWNYDGTEMFALNNEDSSFDFYTIPVTSAGFGAQTDYPGLGRVYGDHIHYDDVTKYVYEDDGPVIDPITGVQIGTFDASGLMVPDGTLGTAFFLGQTAANAGGTTYTLESFDIQKFTPIQAVNIQNVIGIPTHLIRWGTNGLAFTTVTIGGSSSTLTGAVYILSGQFVNASGAALRTAVVPAHNVHRTWKPVHAIRQVSSAAQLSHSFRSE